MGDKEWRNGCRTPTQDPSTNNRWLSVGAGVHTWNAAVYHNGGYEWKGGVGIAVNAYQNRLIGCYLDYSALVVKNWAHIRIWGWQNRFSRPRKGMRSYFHLKWGVADAVHFQPEPNPPF